MASHRNSEILSSFDSDLGRLIEAHQHTTLDYGRHPNFAFFEKIDKNGMDYSFIRALSEEERITVNTISRTHIITWPTRPRPKLKSIIVSEDYIELRLSVGGALNPPSWCCFSEMATDISNEIPLCENWDPSTLHSPIQPSPTALCLQRRWLRTYWTLVPYVKVPERQNSSPARTPELDIASPRKTKPITSTNTRNDIGFHDLVSPPNTRLRRKQSKNGLSSKLNKKFNVDFWGLNGFPHLDSVH